MTKEYEGKTTLYPDGHIDVYGKVDIENVADLAKAYFEKIKEKEIITSGLFNEKQTSMMFALSEDQKAIICIIKKNYNKNKKWPTQANIRDDLSQEKSKRISDVFCKRKIDELKKKNFVNTIGDTRPKRVEFTKDFNNI